jgi:nucleoside-diphosphate-sugar epimerase
VTRVVVTGAAGGIGRAVAPLLPPDWDLVRTDLRPAPGVEALDVTDAAACRTAFAGAAAVVHLAAVPDPEATWDALLPPNVVGVHAVATAAAAAGVPRLVLASSLQAVAGLPAGRQRRTSDAPRPENLYGATKAWAEAVGAWIAATSATSVVALRLGWFAVDRQVAGSAPDELRSAWLSPADAADLIRAAVEAGVTGFTVANGISANRFRRADLTDTMATLGYAPQDDAWA